MNDDGSRVDAGEVVVQELARRTDRPGEQPRWEVRLEGQPIGWIEQKRLRGASSIFYFATAVHPGTGKVYRLEGDIDFDGRVRVIVNFHHDPMSSKQHLGIYSGGGQ